jgi:hypothetical protein
VSDKSAGVEGLAAAFRKLGFSEEESRRKAEYQVSSERPELARMSFLKCAWAGVISEGNSEWIERRIESFRRDPNGEGSGAGRALELLLRIGANPNDLTDLVRAMQHETLSEVCCVIDNCGDTYNDPFNPKAHWHLVLSEVCPPEKNDVGGLHESVLETDPTGREMRPRPE